MSYAYSRPAEGTLTRRIWDIADEETHRLGRLVGRRAVVERAVAEGANPNTASTQYHHWRKHRGEETRRGGLAAVPEPLYVTLQIKEAGRILLPSDVRAALGLAEGDVLTGVVEGGELHLMPRDAGIRKAQELVRRYVPKGLSLVDDLISDRRTEARRENREAKGRHLD